MQREMRPGSARSARMASSTTPATFLSSAVCGRSVLRFHAREYTLTRARKATEVDFAPRRERAMARVGDKRPDCNVRKLAVLRSKLMPPPPVAVLTPVPVPVFLLLASASAENLELRVRVRVQDARVGELRCLPPCLWPRYAF